MPTKSLALNKYLNLIQLEKTEFHGYAFTSAIYFCSRVKRKKDEESWELGCSKYLLCPFADLNDDSSLKVPNGSEQMFVN